MKVSKKIPAFFLLNRLLIFMAIAHLSLSCDLMATIIQVTTSDGGMAAGSLNAALQQAQAGDIIDCSPIAGQTIYLLARLPALGPSFTILGSGVTLDGGSTIPVFSLAQGSATITDFIIQNGNSQGGSGGPGKAGGGGGTGGGGALYINSGTTMTISTISLNNNQASGGNGGAGDDAAGGSGGGGGGFGGGGGGNATRVGAAGSAGGGGGNNGGANGGTDGGAGSPNTFSNFAGAGGGGARPGAGGAASGGTVAATSTSPARNGGAPGASSATEAGGGGGGAGSGGGGSAGSDASTTPEGGFGGAGGLGVGTENTYGAGGGGGGGNGGGAGYGTSGGGGGLNGQGGDGGVLGGGGGASNSNIGGYGGFGAGGGAGSTGGIDIYGLGGAGGSAFNAQAGGGGGSGLGGAIFIQKGGMLIMQDGVSFSGNATIAGIGGIGASSNGGNGSSLGQDIFIQSGANVTFAINNALTLSNPIEGAGFLFEVTGPGVIKSGTGIVNLMGANTYLGGTLIQSGTLNLNGSANGDLNINSGGTFSGNATINGNIYNNGTISPGNSIGQIFTTNLYLYPTSIYDVEVNSAGQSDIITASGFAQIDGGVRVSPDDLNFTTPLTYTIISTSTGVTGQFSSLTSSVPSLISLMYNPLTVQLTYLPVQAVGLTGNALNAANCFTTLPATPGSDVATVTNALLALSFDGMQAAFEQMSPAQFSGPTEVQLLDAILVRYTYTKHLQKFYFYNKCDCGRPLNLWIDGFAQWQRQDNPFGYKDTTLGATIGLDYGIRNWIVGLAFSTTYDRFHWKNAAGKAHLHSYYGGIYGQWNCDEFYIHAALLGARNKYKTTRHINFGTIDRYTYSKHHGNEWLIHAGFEYWLHPSDFQFAPYLNLDYVLQHENGYTEAGANSLDLQVNPKNARLFQGEVGVSLRTRYDACNGVFLPMLSLGYINQTPCSNRSYKANFINSSCIFTGNGGKYIRNLFVSRLAFIYQDCNERINASIYYDGQLGRSYWAQDIVLDLMFHF